MRYLTLSADYMRPSISEDSGGPVEISTLNLGNNFLETLTEWNSRYQIFIPMELPERTAFEREIDKLDQEGLILAEKLQLLLSKEEETKIKYFSEGKLSFIS